MVRIHVCRKAKPRDEWRPRTVDIIGGEWLMGSLKFVHGNKQTRKIDGTIAYTQLGDRLRFDRASQSLRSFSVATFTVIFGDLALVSSL